MTDLPQQPNSHDPNQSQPAGSHVPPAPPPHISYSGGGKETEGVFSSSELPLKAVGQEVMLPKEVLSAGVKTQPTTVPLPPQIANLGVAAVGSNVPPTPTSGSTVTLPLTDAQIAAALHESVTSSIRWLAEWCTRRIKMMHEKVIKSQAPNFKQ